MFQIFAEFGRNSRFIGNLFIAYRRTYPRRYFGLIWIEDTNIFLFSGNFDINLFFVKYLIYSS